MLFVVPSALWTTTSVLETETTVPSTVPARIEVGAGVVGRDVSLSWVVRVGCVGWPVFVNV